MTSPGDTTATGRIVVDGSGVQGGVNQAVSSMTSLYSVVRDNWWGLQAIGRSFSEIGSLAATGIGGAVKAAADYQTQIAAIARTTQQIDPSTGATESIEKTRAAAADLGKQLQALAETRPVDLKTITGIASEAGALGIARQDVVEFTKTIVDLISTTNLTADSAATLAKTANIFGITGDQYAKLGSAIFKAGVSTATTESEIVNMTNRLSPFANLAGLSADQTVGLSAAILSLGPRAEAGATAISRLFQQMATAVSGGQSKEFQQLANTLGVSTTRLSALLQEANHNKTALSSLAQQAGISETRLKEIGNTSITGTAQLKAFADIAGVTSDQFANLVKNDPAQGLVKFVEGVGRVGTDAVATTTALKSLGITEQREIASISALASGTKNGADSNVNLANTLKITKDAFDAGNVTTKAATEQNRTLNAELDETKNVVNNAAIAFGQDMVPAVAGFNSVISDAAKGIESLPAPLRYITEGLVGGIGLLAASAGGLLLLGARAFLAQAAYRQLTASVNQAITQQRAKNAANNLEAQSSLRVAFATGRNYQALQAEITARERALQLLATDARLRQTQLELVNLEIQREEILAEALAVETGERVGNEEQILAQAYATQALIDLKAAEITELEAEVVALNEVNATATKSQVAALGLGAATKSLMGPLGAVLGIAALVGVGFVTMGSSADDDAQKTQQLADASENYYEALQKVAAGQANAVRAAIQQDLVNKHLIGDLSQFGITTDEAINAVLGQEGAQNALNDKLSAGSKYYQEYLLNGKNAVDALNDAMHESGAAFDQFQQAGNIGDVIRKLGEQYSYAVDKQKNQTEATKDTGIAATDAAAGVGDLANKQDKLTDATDGTTAAMKKNQVTVDETAQAAKSLASDTVDLANAQIGVRQAQRDLNDARQKYADRNRDAAKAERDVAAAQAATVTAAQAVKDAQEKLATARADAKEKLQEDVSAEADAHDKVLDAIDAEAEAEKKLADLKGEAQIEKIVDATNKLADARLKLRDATVKQSDAEAQVQYLIDEGASARDIADAKRIAESARQDTADASAGVNDANTDLNDVVATANARALAKAERDVAAAKRAIAEASRKEHDAQKQVNQDRLDIKDDKAYKDAQAALAAAVRAAADASDDLHKAQLNLSDVRDQQQAADNLAQSENAYKTAVIQAANATVTLYTDQRTARGEYTSAKAQLDKFRDGMINLTNTSDRSLRPSLRNLVNQLVARGGVNDSLNIVGRNIDRLNGKKINPTINPSGLKQAVVTTLKFGDWFDKYLKWVSTHKGPAPKPPGLGEGGQVTGGQRNGGISNYGVYSTRQELSGGRYMGEAGSEAILPLSDLWRALSPLTEVARQSDMMSSLVRQIQQAGGSSGGPSVNDNSTTHHNSIKVIANTPVDANNIGRDIVWNMKTSL